MDPRPQRPPPPPPVRYICGDCGEESTITEGSTVVCRECGHRILYKKRTRHIVEFLAR